MLTLGEFMTTRRAVLGLIAGEAAERAGMKPSVWSNWETSRSRRRDGRPAEPRPGTVQRIASALEVPPQVVSDVVLGIDRMHDEADAVDLASEIAAALLSAPVEKRAALADMIRRHARMAASLVALR